MVVENQPEFGRGRVASVELPEAALVEATMLRAWRTEFPEIVVAVPPGAMIVMLTLPCPMKRTLLCAWSAQVSVLWDDIAVVVPPQPCASAAPGARRKSRKAAAPRSAMKPRFRLWGGNGIYCGERSPGWSIVP